MDARRLLSSDLDTMATPVLLQSDCHSVNYCFISGFYGDGSSSPDCDMLKSILLCPRSLPCLLRNSVDRIERDTNLRQTHLFGVFLSTKTNLKATSRCFHKALSTNKSQLSGELRARAETCIHSTATFLAWKQLCVDSFDPLDEVTGPLVPLIW